MQNIYFNAVVQKTLEGKSILVAVIPDDMLGKDMPLIAEIQCFKMPATIYTGTYPQIKVNTDTITDVTERFKGMGIDGILTQNEWYNQTEKKEDLYGISLDK